MVHLDPQLSMNPSAVFTKLLHALVYRQVTDCQVRGAYSYEFGSTDFNIELFLEAFRPFDIK